MLKKTLIILLIAATIPAIEWVGPMPSAGADWKEFDDISRMEVVRLLSDDVDYYEVLGFQTGTNVTAEAIAKRVKELRLRFHEDRARGNVNDPSTTRLAATREEVKELLNKIFTAANILTDPASRREYDELLRRKFVEEIMDAPPEEEVTEEPNVPPGMPGNTEAYVEDEADLGAIHEDEFVPSGANERTIRGYVRMLKRRVNLRTFLQKKISQHDPLLQEVEFHLALRRFVTELIDSRFRPTTLARPVWRVVIPEAFKWSDYLHGFYNLNFDFLHDLMVRVTPDPDLQIAIHLLVLDHIDRASRPNDYMQAVALTLGKYGELPLRGSIAKLYDSHMTTGTMAELFDDRGGARAAYNMRKHVAFDRLVQDMAIRRYIVLNPAGDRAVSELQIRGLAVGSHVWASVIKNQATQHARAMDNVVAAYPRAWVRYREDLYKLSIDRSSTPFARSHHQALYRRLDRIFRDVQRRLQSQTKAQKVTNPSSLGGRFRNMWRRFTKACYDLFLSE